MSSGTSIGRVAAMAESEAAWTMGPLIQLTLAAWLGRR